jgi:hypothetical protein
MFETYRENVDGKYWFPNYSRSDATVKLNDRDVPVRVTIKWSNFKLFAAGLATPPPVAPTSPPSAKPPAKP